MEKRRELGLPRYTLGEEVFSSVSHGVSALFCRGGAGVFAAHLPKTPLRLTAAAVNAAPWCCCIRFHPVPRLPGLNRAKVVFRSLDHCTIFLLIAGTYTPITLVSGGAWKTGPCSAWCGPRRCWGVVLNAVSVERFKKVSMACYLAMGWVVVLAMGTFYGP